jgi:hypothetical protein
MDGGSVVSDIDKPHTYIGKFRSKRERERETKDRETLKEDNL